MLDFELLWEQLLKYFADREYNICNVDDEDKVVFIYTNGDNVSLRLFAWLGTKSETLEARWYYPTCVPQNKRYVVLDLMNRLNYRIIYGGFLMNHEDGSLIFRISAPLFAANFVHDQLDNIFGVGLSAADEEYPKFMSLIYGNCTVEEVLEGEEQHQLRIVNSPDEREGSREAD
jgi:hypothetical protein